MDRSAKHTDLVALLARVEAAEGPDREIDARLWCWENGHAFVAISDGRKCWSNYGDNDSVNPRGVPSAGWAIFRHKAPDRGNAMLQGHQPPRVSASLDAALALVERVLPGAFIELSGPRKYLHIPTPVPNRWRAECGHIGWGSTPALALLAALLKALIAAEVEKAPTP